MRELKNTIERLVIFSDSATISAEQLVALLPHLPKTQTGATAAYANPSLGGMSSTQPAGSLKDAKSEFEREFILRKLRENDWNVSKTAQMLGIERSHLHRKIKAYGIPERSAD